MKRLNTLFAITFFANALFAQAFWERANGPQGLSLRYVQNTPQGILYATCFDKTTFRSTDSGFHWTEIKGPNGISIITGLEVGYNGTLFCWDNTYTAIYRSTDQGESWNLAPNPFQWASAFTEAADGGFLLAVGGSIYRTGDGITWDTLIQDNSWFPTTYFHELSWLADGRLVAASNDIGFLISDDNGLSWDTIPGHGPLDDLAPLGAGQFVLLDKDADALFLTATNAPSAIQLDVPYANAFKKTAVFLVTPNQEIIVSNGEETLISSDNGASWQSYAGYIDVSATHQVLPGGFLLGINAYSGSTTRSTDLGLSWKFSGYGVDRTWAFDWKFKGDNKAFAFTEAGLWRSLDGGDHWGLVPEDSVIPYPRRGYYNIDIAPNGDLYALKPYLLKHSSDDGETFQSITFDSSGGNFGRVAVHPQTGDVYLCGDSGIIRSSDQGLTWQVLTRENHLSSHPIMFHPSGTLYHVIGELSRSDDGGLTWEKVLVNPQYNVLDNLQIAPDGKIVATYGQDSYFSHDNGHTWQKHYTPIDGFTLKLNAAGDAYIANINDKVIYKTTNDGVSWAPLPGIPSTLFRGIIDIAFDNQQHLWVNTDGDGHFKTMETTVGVQTSQAVVDRIDVFPNPATNGFWIKDIQEQPRKNASVILKDVSGREVLRQLLTEAATFVPTSNLVPGFYRVELIENGQLRGAGKLIIK